MDARIVLIDILIKTSEQITPQLKEYLCRMMYELKAKAEKTESPIDDIFVTILAQILGCEGVK